MDRQKRGVSAGTIVMVSVTVLVLALFAVLILPRLGSPREPKTASAASTVRATALPRATARPQTSAAPGVTSAPVRSFTLTAGGTVAMEPEVVKAGYYSEAKRYDFSDTLSLLADDMQADISLVTLENLVCRPMEGKLFLNGTSAADIVRQLPVLAGAIVVYILIDLLICVISMRSYEKAEI